MRKILFLYPNGGRQTDGMLYYDSIKLLHTDGNDVILAKKYSVTQKIKKKWEMMLTYRKMTYFCPFLLSFIVVEG